MKDDCVPELLDRATKALEAEFGELPDFEAFAGTNAEAMAEVLDATARRSGR